MSDRTEELMQIVMDLKKEVAELKSEQPARALSSSARQRQGREAQRAEALADYDEKWRETHSRWPGLKKNARSYSSFTQHAQVLGGEPDSRRFQKVLARLDETKVYTYRDLIKPLKCSKEKARAYGFFLKICGFWIFDETLLRLRRNHEYTRAR